ncbi:TRAPP II complex [Trichophaea hybrida]|nr:TRAPP II complex [Trichophaea hybrida]
MTLDTLSFIAPARLRALLCPLGRIRRSRFSSFVSRLQAANVVRLSDVTPDPKPNRTMFNPQGFPDGHIIWDLTTSVDREHEYLETFELHRRTFVVVAVADYGEKPDPEVLSQQLEDLKSLYPRALYHVCLIFDAPPQAVEHGKFASPAGHHPRFLAVPTQQESRVTSIRTLMCDITTPILSEMSVFARSLQSLPTLDSPLSQESKTPGNLRDRRNSVPPGAGLYPVTMESLANKRKTMTGFGGGGGAGVNAGASERIRVKGKGRVQIAVAQLHLLAGRVPVALKEFTDGAEACRSSNDHLWHGKALEGIGVCLVVLANSKTSFQIPTIPYTALESTKSSKNSPTTSKPTTPNPTPANGLEPSSPQHVLDLLPELHSSIINLYQRAASFPGESVPHISYCETVLRHTKMLMSIHLANGVSADALSHIVTGTPAPRKGPKKNKPSCVEISENAMRAYPHPIEMMTVLEATRVLSGIASILGAVGLRRRKALVTRELVKILIPSLIQARVVGAAEVGIHPAAGLSALGGGHGSPLDLGEGDVETGIMELLEDLCRSYGVLSSLGEENTPKENERPASSGSTLALKTSVWTKAVIAENEIRGFGWPQLKIHVLRNCTALCEALPDFQGVLGFTTQLLKTADIELTQDEQIKLSTTVSRTIGAARKLGIAGVEADYWDQFLLRDIEYIENSTWRPPIPRNRNELVDTDSLMSTATIEEITPFIYNPFKVLESSTEEQILVKNEPAEFKVTLQNPFEFEVEVESVTLDATGVDLDVQEAGVVIAPFRTYQVSIAAIPNNTGEVHILGCRIKVYGCKERSFPIFTGGLDPRERDPKTKRFGLKAAEPRSERPISAISATGRSSLRLPPVLHPIPKTLSLTVVDSLPLLIVKNTSLSQSALMVLEGEKKVFQITLKNLSDMEVDFLAFYFSDSTTGRIQQALAEKTNTPAEIYELELMLAKKRAFVYHRSSASNTGAGGEVEPTLQEKSSRQDLTKRKIYIPANGEASFQIEVLGKPGLTHGTIQANYSHLGVPRSEIVDRFYTREVIYPITVTVNASIELVRVDFIPFSTDFIITSHESTTASLRPFKELFTGNGIYDDPGEYCLMLLDIRNAWPQPLQIKMSIKDSISSSNSFESKDILQAGHTSRIILPVKRIFLSNPYAPIPSISTTQRQFVVSTTKISLDTERQSREAFWYREELLSRLSGIWEELGSTTTKKGKIELRGIRLTPRMVETIRVEDIGVSVSVDTSDHNVNPISPSKFIIPTDFFQTLTTTITNRTSRKIRPILRLLPTLKNLPTPAAFDLNRRFAVNGLLQQALPPLDPGEARKVETGFIVWAKGEYEVSASVEEVDGRVGVEKKVVVDGCEEDGRPRDVLADAAGGRRTCVCREVCLVVARDLESEGG